MKNVCYIILLLCVLLFDHNAFGQTAYRNQEFVLRHDNDVYTFRDSDKYYSNGFILEYRWITQPGRLLSPKNLPDSAKVIIETELSHKTFTPKFLQLRNVERFDRPYAGTFTAAYGISVFPKKFKRWKYGADLTWVGPGAGAGEFQKWYHGLFGFPTPRGWDYQIPNELTINFSGMYQRQFQLVKRSIDLVTETSAMLGTAYINAKQMVDLRFGQLQPLNFSAYANSLIGSGSKNFVQNAHFFVGIGVEYVAHNITIQGSLWNDNAPHTEVLVPWVRHMRTGMAFSSDRTTFKMSYHWVGSEVRDLNWNSYIGLELQLRFLPKEDRKKKKNR